MSEPTTSDLRGRKHFADPAGLVRPGGTFAEMAPDAAAAVLALIDRLRADLEKAERVSDTQYEERHRSAAHAAAMLPVVEAARAVVINPRADRLERLEICLAHFRFAPISDKAGREQAAEHAARLLAVSEKATAWREAQNTDESNDAHVVGAAHDALVAAVDALMGGA